jgi:hypothetical protein
VRLMPRRPTDACLYHGARRTNTSRRCLPTQAARHARGYAQHAGHWSTPRVVKYNECHGPVPCRRYRRAQAGRPPGGRSLPPGAKATANQRRARARATWKPGRAIWRCVWPGGDGDGDGDAIKPPRAQFLVRSVAKELERAYPGDIGTQANKQRSHSLVVACENLLGPVCQARPGRDAAWRMSRESFGG